MTPEQAVERVQRSVLDGAGHEDVTVAESQRPDFTSRTDSERYSFFTGQWHTISGAPQPVDAGGSHLWFGSDPGCPIYDSLVLESLAAPRPSLWTRTAPEWALIVGTLILFVALCCLPLVTR